MATLADKIADGSIQHVVILMLENRSFDEYFGTFPGANGFYTMSAAQATQTFMGPPLPGTETQYLPARLSSFTRALSWPAIAGCNHIWDGQHNSRANGAMNGWQQPFVKWLNNSAGCVGYYLQNDIPYHWSLAQNFVLCDAYHCSVLGRLSQTGCTCSAALASTRRFPPAPAPGRRRLIRPPSWVGSLPQPVGHDARI